MQTRAGMWYLLAPLPSLLPLTRCPQGLPPTHLHQVHVGGCVCVCACEEVLCVFLQGLYFYIQLQLLYNAVMQCDHHV